MIFVTLGSQKFQFNRLLEYIDHAIEQNIIQEPVFAQIGYSTYRPKHYKYSNFLDNDTFKQKIEASSFIITHAGTGAIISSLSKEKKVIAIARKSEFNEHVDDHQQQILKEFQSSNLILGCETEQEFFQCLNAVKNAKLNAYQSNNNEFVRRLDEKIQNISNFPEKKTRSLMAKLLLIIFTLLPFFDSLNGFLVRNYDKSFGTIHHALLTLALLYISKTSVKELLKLFVPILIFLSISIIGNYYIILDYSVNFSWMFKLFSFILNVTAIKNIVYKQHQYEVIDKIFQVSSFLIPLLIFVPKLLGIGNTSYLGRNNGFIGFYSSSNELNIILLVLLAHNLYKLINEKKVQSIISIGILSISLILIESKASLIFLIILFSTFLFEKLLLDFKSFKLYMKRILISIPFVFLCLLPLKNIFLNFFKRQSFLFNHFVETTGGNFFTYLSSGRLNRVIPLFAEFSFDNIHSSLISIFQIIFGNGFYNIGEFAVEMEVFDTFDWFGIIGAFFICLIYYHFFKKVIKKNSIILIIGVITIIIFSFFAGHVIYGGTAGIYVAIALILFTYQQD